MNAPNSQPKSRSRTFLLLSFCLLVTLLTAVNCGDSGSDALVGSRQAIDFTRAGANNGPSNGLGGGPKISDVGPGSGQPVPIGPGGQTQSGLYGEVTSASDGLPLVGATVTLLDSMSAVVDTRITGAGGFFSFGTPPPGDYTLIVSSVGLLDSERALTFTGEDLGLGVSLSAPVPTGQMRVVLSWGLNPRDLDAHLFLPPTVPYHIFFSRRGSLTLCPFAALDADDTTSFGPETITIAQPFSGTYEYAVYIFSGTGDFNTSEAYVEVFDSNGRVDGFTPPPGGAERWWRVLSIDGDTLAVTPVNTLLNDFAPYPDTGAGCAGL